MEATVNDIRAIEVLKSTAQATKDDGRVRMGLMSPSFPPVRVSPAEVADKGKTRLGLMSPSFPVSRTR
jgi:hypothetical protein